MKKILMTIIIFALTITGCSSNSGEAVSGDVLLVSDGKTKKEYKVEDLQQLDSINAVFNEVVYMGVPTSLLFKDAGIDISNLRAFKAIASDGYSVNYEPELFLRDDVIVAYQQQSGSLSDEDGIFRMVLPGEEGKLNIRNLVELQAVP